MKKQEQKSITRQAEAFIPTAYGAFNLLAYAKTPKEKSPHLALVHEKVNLHQPVLVRIHSECITGDTFHSKRCDCGEQLEAALKHANKEAGIVIYLRQEGRGIGLINKLKAYNLQDQGFNTAEANIHLGFDADPRDYKDAVAILQDLNITQINLMTNNPNKIKQLEKGGIKIIKRIPIIITPKSENEFYLHTKQDLMGHLLNL